jgi:hypothetical protein
MSARQDDGVAEVAHADHAVCPAIVVVVIVIVL